MKILGIGASLLLASGLAFGCSSKSDVAKNPGSAGAGDGGAGGAGEVAQFELIGDYADVGFEGEEVITQDAWNTAKLVAYDNDKNVAYTQFPKDDMFNPNKFGKIVYTDLKDGAFYYCTVVFDAETLADAQASDATADPSDPDNSGCGGMFPWTKATAK